MFLVMWGRSKLFLLLFRLTMRCTKIIPRLAKSLPKNVSSVPWPTQVVQDAQTGQVPRDKYGTALSNQPLAYFKDNNGQLTKNIAQAAQLFVNIPMAKGTIYSQEIVPQPNWLNSYQGIMTMLRACLGDFSALLDPIFNDYPILDPCIRCIVTNAAATVNITTAQSCQQCTQYIKNLENEIAKAQAQQQITPPPGGPDGLPSDDGQE